MDSFHSCIIRISSDPPSELKYQRERYRAAKKETSNGSSNNLPERK